MEQCQTPLFAQTRRASGCYFSTLTLYPTLVLPPSFSAWKLLPAAPRRKPAAPDHDPWEVGVELAFADLAWHCRLPQVFQDAPAKARKPRVSELGSPIKTLCLGGGAALSLSSTYRRVW